jgi:hypothetical protein
MEFPNTAIYGDEVAGRAAQVHKLLSKLVSKIDENTFDVAELLYEDQENGYYRARGQSSIWEYARKTLGIKERKARYLIRIVEVCRAAGIPRQQYEPVGISKLREITRLDPTKLWFNEETKKNEPLSDWIRHFIANGAEYTVEELNTLVNERLDLVEDNALVFEPAYQVKRSVRDLVIKPAQELARRLLGSAGTDGDGMAVEYSRGVVEEIIHADFIVGNQGAQDGQQSQEQGVEQTGEAGGNSGTNGTTEAASPELASGEDAQEQPGN